MLLDKFKKMRLFALVAVGPLLCVCFAATAVEPPQTRSPVVDEDATTPSPAQANSQPLSKEKLDPKPAVKGPNKLLLFNSQNVFLFDPDGKNEKKISDQLKSFPAEMVIGDPAVGEDKLWLSPDGKRLAAVMFRKRRGGFAYPSAPGTLYVADLDENAQWIDLNHRCLTAAWSPDGNQVATTDWDTNGFNRPNKRRQTTSHLINVKTKEKEKLNLPDNHVITDWTRDGKHLLTYSIHQKDDGASLETTRLYLMNRDGTEHKALSDVDLDLHSGRISPDETRVLCIHPKENAPRRGDIELLVLDVARGKSIKVGELPDGALLRGFCWSPDGKQIAYTYAWSEADKDNPPRAPAVIGSHVVVRDAEGKNPKTVVTQKRPSGKGYPFSGVDWR